MAKQALLAQLSRVLEGDGLSEEEKRQQCTSDEIFAQVKTAVKDEAIARHTWNEGYADTLVSLYGPHTINSSSLADLVKVSDM